ncbi:MAG TPA: ATP-binding protein [Gammaproteobacteria bacterium]
MALPVVMAWSGGKDSALALWRLRDDPRYEVVALLTTLSEPYRRIVMHGVREEVLDAQAAAIGLPLTKTWLPATPSNTDYETRMGNALRAFRESGVLHVAHGDLFLEDVRAFRDAQLARLDMHGLYPLWGEDTRLLARTFTHRGFKATISCVDGEKLGPRFAGREFDYALQQDLPPGIDPCGEYGEFHSCVHVGPIFRRPLSLRTGERVTRMNRFHYCDLLPGR